MKKPFLYFSIVLVLAALAFYLYRHNQKSATFSSKAFAIEDTASITKVFLADKKGNKVTLTRQKAGQWMVNNKFAIRNDAINMLLKTIKLVEIKNAVAKTAHNNIVKDMAARAVKMEIYTNDAEEPELVYYIGGPNQTTSGSFMLMQGTETPYVCHIPGFEGYLSTRFMVKEKEWRNTEIFNFTTISEIKSVSVQYPKRPASSFELTVNSTNSFTVRSLQTGKEIPNLDTSAVKDYLIGWKFVNFEAFENVPKAEKDSLLALGCEYIFTMKKSDSSSKTISAFLKRPSTFAPQYNNRPAMQDLDRMYGQLPGETDWVIIQFFVFDKLMIGIDDFRKGPKPMRNS